MTLSYTGRLMEIYHALRTIISRHICDSLRKETENFVLFMNEIVLPNDMNRLQNRRPQRTKATMNNNNKKTHQLRS